MITVSALDDPGKMLPEFALFMTPVPMPATASPDSVRSPSPERLATLTEHVDFAGMLLPTSGPITAFVFLNTLEAFEDRSFEQGVEEASNLFGCQAYLPEQRYREELAKGRITLDDLSAALREECGADEMVSGLSNRFVIRLAALEHEVRQGPVDELRWFVAETDALFRFRTETPSQIREQMIAETQRWVMHYRPRAMAAGGQTIDEAGRIGRLLADLIERFGAARIEKWPTATWEAMTLQCLWRVCREGVETVPVEGQSGPVPMRPADLLRDVSDERADVLVHETLIPFCAAFADQGFAGWTLPNREQGFFRSFLDMYRSPSGPMERWLRGVPSEARRITDAGMSAAESVVESLELMGVSAEEEREFIVRTLLALRGWASMLRQLDVRGDRVAVPARPGTLLEFLAVRLILDRVAAGFVAAQAGWESRDLGALRRQLMESPHLLRTVAVEQRAFTVFQRAQLLGWSPARLFKLSREDWRQLVLELEGFREYDRRRVFHTAYERHYRDRALSAIAQAAARPLESVAEPKFQAVFCIDAREESFRRHIEEVDADIETFGAPGFFCVPIYYRGLTDAHFAALCPIVLRPKHWLTEEVVVSFEDEARRREKNRRVLGTASHRVHHGSRTLAAGAVLTAGFGVLASVPLVMRVLFPRLTSIIRRSAGRLVQPPAVTRLRLERENKEPGPTNGGVGFSVEEMAAFGERVLRDIGLTRKFARLVMFVGHGSFCLNNPHKSAYDCGACSGSAGGPNGRALAAMLNDDRVRALLEQRGIAIPHTTRFLGGQHNTCNDSVEFFDRDLLPPSHQEDYREARRILDEACERNSHERCRRFHSAPLDFTPAQAHRHVEGRAEDLAQVRPEFGNASNALCFVGRRERVRGLYMDRRSFMHSYDPTTDDGQGTILGRILGAVVPVCEGINLTYYFSSVDSPGWGCGTKLPHNVTSLLGVMDGAGSDLRLGLPWQGVEIHEPMRLLFVMESTPEIMNRIMDRNPQVGRILRNGWAQLAVLDPWSPRISLLRDGQFGEFQPIGAELPLASNSADWYRGWRDHLEFALISDEWKGSGNTLVMRA
jgi:uncharacterized protein